MDPKDNKGVTEQTDAERALAEDLLGGGPNPNIDTSAAPHPLLSAEEIEEIRAQARTTVLDEQKKAARDAMLAEALADARREAGMSTGDSAKDEIVDCTLDLAEHSDRITLNGMAYWHGQTYPVPRHVADTLRDIQFRGWAHQFEIDGKGKDEFYRRHRGTVLSATKGAQNAPQAMV